MLFLSWTMPALVRLTACWVLRTARAAARNWFISALLAEDSSSRIEDWSRICCGLPEVSRAIEEFRVPCS